MKMHELLDSPEKWTRNYLARDTNGNPVVEESLDAVCFCIVGALYKCYEETHDRQTIFSNLVDVLKGQSPAAWNDDPRRKFEDVHKLLKQLDI